MKIAIDVQPLQYGARDAGIGRYLRNLLEQLVPLANGHEVELLANGRVDPARDLKLAPSVRWPVVRLERSRRLGERSWMLERLRYPRLLRRRGIDVVHANSLAELDGITTPRPTRDCAVVVTVHDLVPCVFPEEHSAYWPRTKLSYDFHRKLADVARADAVLVPSEHTRRDLVDRAGIAEDRIFVTPEAVEARFAPIADPRRRAALRRRYGLPERFVLYLGGYYSARKNLGGLLEAWRRFLRAPGAGDATLVLAGARDARGDVADAARRTAAEAGLGGRVLLTDFVADEDVPALLGAATVFVYPSLYEGFGLTPLEAMACGVPVVTGNGSSIPEVVGDAASCVDPLDPDALAAALLELWRDPARRERLGAAGRARSRVFSWRRMAEQTLAAYERAVEERPAA